MTISGTRQYLRHMDTDTNGFLVYVLLVAVAAIIAQSRIRRLWVTSASVAVGCSVLNIAYEIVRNGFHVRPSDVAFWLPILFVYGAAIAFPVALLVGLPFY